MYIVFMCIAANENYFVLKILHIYFSRIYLRNDFFPACLCAEGGEIDRAVFNDKLKSDPSALIKREREMSRERAK